MKERAQLEEMYHRGNCPWMIWDPERSGAARRRAAPFQIPLAAPLGRQLECSDPSVLPLHLDAPRAGRCRCSRSARIPTTSRSAPAGRCSAWPTARRGLRAHYVVLTGTAERQQEARAAASAFLPGADLPVDLLDLPEGRLPAVWGQVKDVLEEVARSCSPDLILAPSPDDAHQDHRTIGEIVPTVFRDQLYLGLRDPEMGR